MIKVNENGVVQFDEAEALELLYRGYEMKDISLINKTFDHWAKAWDRPEDQSAVGEKIAIEERTKQWLFDFPEFNIREELVSRCKNQQEIDRINLEMDMFEARDLLPVLRLMFYLVDHFRKNNIVWGVGRGSSCSSYALYRIGIHKIDSIKYGLDIKDFLKD